jgi:apolipoprotein D and lipocalin family protein
MKKKLLLLLAFPLISGCASTPNPPTTASQVNLSRYMGRWYEIASFPNFFQKGCQCTMADYKLGKDVVRIKNSCYKGVDYKLSSKSAKGWPVVGSHNSKLRVQFFWPFKADYWVLYVSKNYKEAIVGTPSREYLWILSRNKHISSSHYAKLISIAKQKGFDVMKLIKTKQNCDN